MKRLERTVSCKHHGGRLLRLAVCRPSPRHLLQLGWVANLTVGFFFAAPADVAGTLFFPPHTVLFIGGIVTIISLKPICWVVGVYMLCCGVVVGMLEAPMIYQFFDCTKGMVVRLQAVLPWHRAVFYVGCVRMTISPAWLQMSHKEERGEPGCDAWCTAKLSLWCSQ